MNAWLNLLPANWQPVLQQWAASANDRQTLASTVFFAGVILAQVGNAFACRTEKERGRNLGWLSNRFLLVSIAVELLVAVALIYWKPLADVFGLTPLPPIYWLGLGLYAPALYSLDRVRKSVLRRVGESRDRRRNGQQARLNRGDSVI